jgi:uncharacterized protein
MKTLDIVAAVLVIIGAINWGLVGLAQFDLVAAIFGMQFGQVSPITSIIYALVGLAGVYELFTFRGMPRRWGGSSYADQPR